MPHSKVVAVQYVIFWITLKLQSKLVKYKLTVEEVFVDCYYYYTLKFNHLDHFHTITVTEDFSG